MPLDSDSSIPNADAHNTKDVHVELRSYSIPVIEEITALRLKIAEIEKKLPVA